MKFFSARNTISICSSSVKIAVREAGAPWTWERRLETCAAAVMMVVIEAVTLRGSIKIGRLHDQLDKIGGTKGSQARQKMRCRPAVVTLEMA